MFFFVNQYLLSNNSSIEHAEIKRLKLFKKHNVEAKLVTRDYDSIIHDTLKRFGLDDDQLINMFDYFAGTVHYQGKAFHVEDLHLPFDYQVDAGNNSRKVNDAQRLVAEIFFIGGRVAQVDHVDWYDDAGNLSLRERYDLRGFKSVDVFFGQDGQTHYERYYRPDGSCYLERFYVQSTQNTPINSLNILKNYNGQDLYFDGIDELYSFFLNELNKSVKGPNSFIADRPAIAINPVLNVEGNDAKKYLWMAIPQVNDGGDQNNGPLNQMLQRPLTTSGLWDGIITMTEKQAELLKGRLNDQTPIYVINGTPVQHPIKRIMMSKRTRHQLIYVGRLGDDKQINQLISIFDAVHKNVKDAKLTIYGYGTPNDTARYKSQLKQTGLEKSIEFAGYQVNLQDAYDQAQLFIDASRIDVQPLSVGEALSHGVPVVSYDYLYGPAELIKPDVNGKLIPLNNQSQFIQTVVDLLKSPVKLQELSNGAYAGLDSISDTTTWQEWEKLIQAGK